ncbi:MAG: serine/threonine-protein phosphatase [Deltaproteobacteria bacterium]|jgi:protein phosphatase|nr:serine/threonine-protein phosphatase [Deltaproteobacteria bacterium]
MKVSSLTDIGLVRPYNQDQSLVKRYPDGSLLAAVADGLSSQPAGDRAALIAIGCVADFVPDPSKLQSQLHRLFHRCDEKIQQTAVEEPSLENMATTLTVALVISETVHWAHVGDCRLYLCRGEEFLQITQDDTLAGFYVATGKLTKEEARKDSSRHGLFECLGRGDAEVKTGSFAVKQGDLLLLSSDGLHDHISEEFMHSILKASELDLNTKLEQLIRVSKKEEGSDDNLTAICIKI